MLLVHGVGLGRAGFRPLEIRARLRGVPVSAFDRRGYDGRPPTADLPQHVADLCERVDELTDSQGSVVVAGVSGGATLTLALAAARRSTLHAAVVHEPLIGPAAPDQHATVVDSIERFRRDHAPDAFDRFMERLLTPETWRQVPERDRRAARSLAGTARAEVEGFADFALGRAELRRVSTRTTWTFGAESPRWRHAAAAVAAEAGIRTRIVAGGHAPQLTCPDEWLDAIVDARDQP